MRNGYWGWGATMIDFNNDKYVDFFMTNGTTTTILISAVVFTLLLGFDSTSTTTDDAFATDPAILWMNRGPAMNLSTVDVQIQNKMLDAFLYLFLFILEGGYTNGN